MNQIKEQEERQDIHDTKSKQNSAKGVFNKYANRDLIPTEKEAWSKVALEKHDKD